MITGISGERVRKRGSFYHHQSFFEDVHLFPSGGPPGASSTSIDPKPAQQNLTPLASDIFRDRIGENEDGFVL